MKEFIEQLVPHATGLERIVVRGHLVTIATNQGDYRTGLTENEQLEAEFQAFRDEDDYLRNLQATITQQIDCLLELDRLDDAERRWHDAHDRLPQITEDQAESEARLMGQLAHLRREQDRSRFLHLKALLLERYNAPGALERFLESYQHDLLRGDNAGVAISLHAIARIYFDEHEYDHARERIREELPFAGECGLVSLVGSLSFLWAEIDLAEGKNTSTATWLITARNNFAEDQDDDGVENATRLLTDSKPNNGTRSGITF